MLVCQSWYKMIIGILNQFWLLVLLICIWYPDGRPRHKWNSDRLWLKQMWNTGLFTSTGYSALWLTSFVYILCFHIGHDGSCKDWLPYSAYDERGCAQNGYCICNIAIMLHCSPLSDWYFIHEGKWVFQWCFFSPFPVI